MFARVKKSGKYQYLQIVENRKEKGKVKQRVIATIGRMDQLQAKGRVATLIRSLCHSGLSPISPSHFSQVGNSLPEAARCISTRQLPIRHRR